MAASCDSSTDSNAPTHNQLEPRLRYQRRHLVALLQTDCGRLPTSENRKIKGTGGTAPKYSRRCDGRLPLYAG